MSGQKDDKKKVYMIVETYDNSKPNITQPIIKNPTGPINFTQVSGGEVDQSTGKTINNYFTYNLGQMSFDNLEHKSSPRA
jgi:hypothetical protein